MFGGIAGQAVAGNGGRERSEGQDARRGPGSAGVPPPRWRNAAPLKYNAMKIEMAKGLLASGLEKLNTPA